MWAIKVVSKEAEREILDLPPDLKASFLHITEMIIRFGPQNVGMPHVRSLGGKLWEIRLKGKDNIARSIYVLGGERRVFILHTFVKKTQKTPIKAMKIAKARLKEVPND